MKHLGVNENLVNLYLNSTSEGVFVLDGNKILIFVNDRYSEITGEKSHEHLGSTPTSVGKGWHDDGFYKRMWDSVEENDFWEGETWDKKCDDGSLYVMNQKIIKYKINDSIYYLGIISDITTRLKALQELQYHERIDQSTNITNRFFGEKKLNEYLKDKGDNVAVILLDINNFSSIPETFGHSQADYVLKDVANRLKQSIVSDNIFSFGQDRFVLYFQYEDSLDIENKAFGIIDAFHEPFKIDSNEFFLSVNLGISLYKADGDEPDELIKNSDSAMHESRKEEFNTFAFYEAQMNETVLEQFQLIGDLRRSIERNELSMMYQPQVDIKKSKVTGAEALLRWNSRERGSISPSKFIPLAEKKGLITPIGEWVLRNACDQFVNWQSNGIENVSLAINISGAQFHDKRLLPLIQNIFYNRVDTSLIELEITESAFVDDVDLAIKTMKNLKNMGFKLAIDDFGTGFSSLSYLKKFPIDKLKIDKSFVDHILDEPGDRAIIKSIITLADNLELKVIAEGVESKNQQDFLIDLGCSLIQGYYYSKPLTSNDFIYFCKEGIII